MNVLMETIEEMEGKIIIWSRFRHDIIKITEKLKQTYGSNTVVNYFGDTTMQDRQDAIEKFQNLEDDVKFSYLIHKLAVWVLHFTQRQMLFITQMILI